VVDPAQSYGLKRLDALLAGFINLERGFFVEAGANDGIAESNTLLFERHRDWRGILVEPVPDLAERCRRNRPDAVVEQVALVSFDYPLATIRMHYSDLMSLVDGARGSAAEDAHWAQLGFSTTGNAPDLRLPRNVEVPAAPLSAILDRHAAPHVDLLSLDVEGYEPSVLRGLDFDRHRPTFVVVEAWNEAELDTLLLPHYEKLGRLCAHELDGRTWHDVLYRVKDAPLPQAATRIRASCTCSSARPARAG
jgi:FkbM family methyltransferase